MGCVRMMRWRGSSCVTFWWSLLALAAPGTVLCLNYTRRHSQSSDKLINTTNLRPRSTETLQQPRAAPRDSPASAHWASAPSKEWATNSPWRARRDEILLGKSSNFVIHHFSDSAITCFRIKAMKLNGKAKVLASVTMFFKHPQAAGTGQGSADIWVLPAHWSSQPHCPLCRAAGALPMPTAPWRAG